MADAEAGIFVPPQRRNLGMVFQSYAIWPHMTVLENVAYALEGRGIGRAERKKLAMEALALVQLDGFAERPAPRLSGGQQQRVAIARAMVGHPQALLFDEPLSNLDAKLRIEMRNELRRIQRESGLTSIYVTHDQAEALAISDLIIVMKDGHIVERGRPVDIYRRPRHVFTAQFLGATNLIAGTVAAVDAAAGALAVTTALGPLLGVDPTGSLRPGAKVVVSIRPEDLSTRASRGRRGQHDRGTDDVRGLRGRGGRGRAQVRGNQYCVPARSRRRPDARPSRDVAGQAGCLPGAAGRMMRYKCIEMVLETNRPKTRRRA